ncbi:hypothetical protein [Actinosynnema sp. NPDC023587]|uniref:hypothetical protein n=1 Tax=Actinosynnema sp. NPDC023587 TaxID=3154695 RepID=UPI0033DCE8EB
MTTEANSGAERPDRYGEPRPVEHVCRNGWIDPDADNPRPCLECKPHLAPARRVRTGWP